MDTSSLNLQGESEQKMCETKTYRVLCFVLAELESMPKRVSTPVQASANFHSARLRNVEPASLGQSLWQKSVATHATGAASCSNHLR